MELNLDGQVAIVTGASRGIGAAIADALAGAGARVVGTATTAAGAEAIAPRTESLKAPHVSTPSEERSSARSR